ncbi:4-alpha-glucanotransferase [Clostridiales bacterium PH28_bin88]|nr:4-alpha-glucanotransferase [Clostridiales bacterium PH28_bin88]
MGESQIRMLHQLARQYGVETSYQDVTGRRQDAAPDSLLAVLRELGAPVERLADVPGALRERRQEQWQRCSEPVVVAWQGRPGHLELRLPATGVDHRIDGRLELEGGEVRQWTNHLVHTPVLQVSEVEGVAYTARLLSLPADLPPGYHRLTLSMPGRVFQTLLIAAPFQAYVPPLVTAGRTWGVFLPLYALHSGRSWAAGDLTDLEALLHWVQELGGGMVGTLPLLAAFLDEPFDPSPYAPASRLFWNEFYLDATRIPELGGCPPALDLLNSPAFQSELTALRNTPLVDYRRGLAVKRRILELLSHCCHSAGGGRRAALQGWAAAHPAVQDYARFRAAVERQGAAWPGWPDRMRDGSLQDGDFDPAAERYHLYVQWQAQEQFQALSAQARDRGPGLYLDLPLGVHRAGYDVWREGSAFALEASCGAPPDLLIPEGQNWEFPPMHPERIRQQAYRYYIAVLRHHLRHAGILRLDHVMGLHHLFWIPKGLPAREGVYVRYRDDEFYAILALESHRHRTLLVGEDLGTVPRYVRTAMTRHKVYRMYVLPFEYTPAARQMLNPIPTGSMASLNTHDMPPFAAFWLQRTPGDRLALFRFLRRKGWLKVPTDDTKAMLEACLKSLSASRARVLMVNLEDLWLETSPQNIPGTGDQYPNWRRKARYTLEEFMRIPEVLKTLQGINKLRKRGTGR